MKVVTITPPEPREYRRHSAQGTRVESDGHEVHGIKSININMSADEPITANLELYATFKGITGHGHFVMTHPLSGGKIEIKAIECVDGTRIEL